MLTRYACTAAELSCVIGNIFAELSPPCAACGAEVLQITGTTVTGNAATLTVEQSYQSWRGHAEKGNSYHLIRRTDQYYNSLMKSKEAAQCQKH